MTAVGTPVSASPSWRERHPAFSGALAVWIVAFCAGIVATVAGFLGAKGMVLVAAAFGLIAVLLVVTKREELILGTAVLSVFALFHKSLGTQYLDVSGGPISVYVSSFDVMVFVLWFTWFVRGPREMAQQLRLAFRRPVMWAPIAGFALVLPSIVDAPVTGLALAEVVRMMSAIAVFVYFAVRIRSKQQVWIVLGALGAGLCVEALVVAGQYATHGTLGMSAFGTPTQLNNRFDGYDALRPFGTIVHPVFLGAFVAPCALMAYSLAANLRSTRLRLVCLAVAVVGVTPIFFANARSATFGIVIAFVVLTVVFIVTGRLTRRDLKFSIIGLVVVLVLGFPLFSGYLERSFGTRSTGQTTRTATCTRAVDAATACPSHFSFEWRARMQLNHLGVKIWEDKPVVGQGLNNFEQVMGGFDTYGLIFADAPVHNLYLLQLAESGVIGLAGLLLLAIPLFLVAVRLARSKDRLLSAVGFGTAGMFVFFAVEELLEFSLRQEQPRALFFMLAGLAVACARLAGLDRPRPVLQVRHLDPPPPTNGDRAPSDRRLAGRTANGNGNGNGNGARPKVVPRDRYRARAARVRHRRYRTRSERLREFRARRRRFVSAGLVGVLMGASGLTFAAAGSSTTADPSVNGLRIVFAAFDRSTGNRNIYTVNADGSDLQQVSPNDGRDYSWPVWAYNGQGITFTAHASGAGDAEPVYLANADGTGMHPITANAWRNAQGHVAADGRSMIFTSFWSEYQKVGIYRMDFATGAVTNLSAVHSQSGAFDSDPVIANDGRIFFIDAADPATGANRAGQVAVMNGDGTNRRLVTNDGFYDTDPRPSPDLSEVAIARYVGPGSPQDPNSDNPFQARLQDFVLVDHNLATGFEQQLTLGKDCYTHPESSPCSPAEGPAYVPQWTPDGSAIGYMSVLSSKTTCICVVNRDGTSPRVVFSSNDLAINWFDWIRPSAPAPGSILDPKPQGQLTPERMIVSGVSRDGNRVVLETTPDRFDGVALPIPASFGPESASLSPDRSQLYFDGEATYDPNAVQYGPPPPPGVGRTRHYTLNFLQQYYRDPSPLQASSASRQLWSLDLSKSGKLAQRTTVGTEDYRDAIPDGEVRGNVTPAVSPDGRYVLFTNVSTVSNESFILRYDRVTGEVLNLTNATAGAVAVADAQPAWSADSKHVAFASDGLDGMQIWVMDADGYHARKLTDDNYVNMMPAWSPDGRYVVYASYRGTGDPNPGSQDPAIAASQGGIDLKHWVLVRVEVATGKQQVLVQSNQSPMFRPVYAPDGSKIYYIGISGPPLQSDVYVVGANGGVGHPVQVTTNTFETSVDIR